MTRRQLAFGVFAICALVVVSGMIAYVSITRYEKDAEINAQTQIERSRIEEEAKLERTRERMNVIPWYKGGSNN